MSNAKLSVEKRRASALRQQHGWRFMAAAAAGWLLATIALPLGTTEYVKVASASLRFLAAYGLAGLSIAAALIALWIFKPWKRRGMRSWSILLILTAIFLGDAYILSWWWRL